MDLEIEGPVHSLRGSAVENKDKVKVLLTKLYFLRAYVLIRIWDLLCVSI